ncbi:MAG: ATP-binding protein [Myxococcota bacterium]
MSVRERLVLSTLAAVVTTAVLVGLLGRIGPAGPGGIATQVVAAAIAFGLAALAARLLVQLPLDAQLDRFVGAVRGSNAPPDEVDPELAALRAALIERVAEVDAAADRYARESRTATEILDTSPFGIAMVDPDGRITHASVAFRGLFRLRGEPVGKRPIEVVPVVEIHEVLEDALAGQVSEKAFVTASLDLVARAVPLSGGRAIVRVEDVTGRKEAERARTDFVANVSHELRTPLTAIMGYLETLLGERERIPDDLLPLVETAERNARRLRDLFEDLLKLHRIEARRRELPLDRHRLRPILEDAVGPARDRARMRNQEFVLDCPADLDGLVNPEAFGAIVGNLVSNASAYTTEGGHVQVRAIRDERGEVRIEVQDDGIGIAEKHHERVFERFYRVDEARSRRVGGTGLGLAIVKHYALASKCNVTLRSKEGAGTTFTVFLPMS